MMIHRFQKPPLALVTLVLIGLSLLHGVVPVAEANVSLTSFEVVRGDNATDLVIRWETESETDMVGFRVKRSTAGNVQQATVVKTVPNGGSATTGASYSETDAGLTTGQTYFYWLYEIKSDGTENLLTQSPDSEAPGTGGSPTNTPTPTATTIPTQAQPTATPTTPGNFPTESTATPTVIQGVNPTATTPSTNPTPTFTVPSQATNTPVGQVATPLATSTPVPALQDQPTISPAVAVPTAIVEGMTPVPAVATPLVQADATVDAGLQAVSPTDQGLQVPPTPTQAVDSSAPAAAPADTASETAVAGATPQAVAQGSEGESAAPNERLARPTATPRPASDAESSDSTGDLLLVFGGASLCGAVVLALAALVIWRRR